MGLFYVAYRYNVLYVAKADVDTRGLIYLQALKELLSDVYLAEICLVGMLIVSKAARPAFLMAVLLALLAKIPNPLLYSVPPSLQFQDNLIDRSQPQNEEDGQAQNGVGPNSTVASKSKLTSKLGARATGGDRKKATSVSKWLKAWIYADYATVGQLMHHEDRKGLEHHQVAELHAYFPPSVTSRAPFLWVTAVGDAGISKQEIFHMEEAMPISNKGCKLNDKNQIQRDTEEPRPRDWCEKIDY
ncbi:putative membrane protein [Fusarium oxysporum f. sp. rapae]|uniref:Putative membrane protein n=1 Tax=Fusarium oxysporum f. sp. rapae TaxID=485398 RepID=A0A8J5NSL1_FUSOX|nr:putative membrane protein [Fusarium oxysporum f. sp. rapae]